MPRSSAREFSATKIVFCCAENLLRPVATFGNFSHPGRPCAHPIPIFEENNAFEECERSFMNHELGNERRRNC